MVGDADIAALGGILSSRARVAILFALGDGRALPATVLAHEAGVAASTASGNLSTLVDAGLLAVERHGRHRYYRLAGPGVGDLLETLAEHAPPSPVTSLRQGRRAHAIRYARTCYDHLAGRVGAALMGALIDRGALVGGDGSLTDGDRLSSRGDVVEYRLTDAGARLLDDLGVDCAALARGRRPLVRYCVDWSEQRHHLAGSLGAALTARLVELGWIRRRDATRAVTVTATGVEGLRAAFGLEVG